MARSSDIRSFIAKKFPTTSFEIIYTNLKSLWGRIEEAKKAEGYKPEYGTSFRFEWLNDVVHIKPGKKIGLVSAGSSFTENSIKQFIDELYVFVKIDCTTDLTFTTMFDFAQVDEVKGVLSPIDLAGINGELYATLMKRWYNSHRDGAKNSTTIIRRLKQIDAHVEILLDGFDFVSDTKQLVFTMYYFGKTMDCVYRVPDLAFDSRYYSKNKYRLLNRDHYPARTKVENTYIDWVNRISDFSSIPKSNIDQGLQDIINEVVKVIVGDSKSIMTVSAHYSNLDIKAFWMDDKGSTDIVINVTNPRWKDNPEARMPNLVSDLSNLISDMNRASHQLETDRHTEMDPFTLLNRITDGMYEEVYADKIKGSFGDFSTERIDGPEDSALFIIPVVKKFNEERRYQFKFVQRFSTKIVVGGILPENIILTNAVNKVSNDLQLDSRKVDWTDVSPKKLGLLKRFVSLFK